jgi:transposase-like protein
MTIRPMPGLSAAHHDDVLGALPGAGRHFDREVIVLCVRWYLSFKLSSRDLVQMMNERGIMLALTTIFRWVQRYVPDFAKRWREYAGCGSDGLLKLQIKRDWRWS